MPTEDLKPAPEDAEQASLQDVGYTKDAGGPPSHDEGRSRGQLVPGPKDQQPNTVGPIPSGSFQDTYDWPYQPGPSRHESPSKPLGVGLRNDDDTGDWNASGVDDDMDLRTAGGDPNHGLVRDGINVGKKMFDLGGSVEEVLFYDTQLDAGFVYGSYLWGAVTPTGTGPRVSSAVGTGFSVRVVFNQAMRNHPYLGGVLDPNNYIITEKIGGRRLLAYHVRWSVPYTEVEVFTEEFHINPIDYNVQVRNAESATGDVVDPLYDNADFTASGSTFPAATDLYSFYGLEAGLQANQETDIDPDTDGPVLQNLNPAHMQTNVLIGSNIFLDIVDPGGSGVEAASVIISIHRGLGQPSVDVWKNDAQQPGYVVTKTPVAFGFRYEINPDVDLPDTERITMDVYAKDTATIQNELDTSYYFDTEIIDFVPPYLDNLSPDSGDIDVPANTNVQLDILDLKAGVVNTTVKIWINSILAWDGSAGGIQPGFSGTEVPASPKGYRYNINPNSDFPFNSLVLVQVQAYDNAGVPNFLDTSYSFITAAIPSTVKVSQILVVAEDSIRLVFTGNVVKSDTYLNPSSYELVDLDGTEQPTVDSVYPVDDQTPGHVTLGTKGLRAGKRYSIEIGRHTVYDGNGYPLTDILEKFLMRRTKTDSALQGAARRFNKKIGGDLRGVLEAVMISDEEIGGDF